MRHKTVVRSPLAVLATLGGVFAIGLGLMAPAADAAPVVTIAPSGTPQSGDQVTVSVGPNSIFTPHAKVNILECADPGGTGANLPTDDSTCDGNTIQGGSVLVQADGSFSVANYTLYQLPNPVLGEQPNFQPVCNQSNPCVLYVGQDQNDFSQPKLFSAPFSIGPGPANPAGSTTVPGATSPGGGSNPTPAGTPGQLPGATGRFPLPGRSLLPAKASTSAPGNKGAGASGQSGGTLAFTGAPLIPLAGTGALLVALGLLGRRLALRANR